MSPERASEIAFTVDDKCRNEQRKEWLSPHNFVVMCILAACAEERRAAYDDVISEFEAAALVSSSRSDAAVYRRVVANVIAMRDSPNEQKAVKSVGDGQG